MSVLGPHPLRLPLGHSDYVELRRAGFTYVDKTAFVAQVLDGGSKAQLHPRPRRFGKTLNLSTLRHFLERGADDLTPLFEDTWLWNAGDGARRIHFQRYPVVYLTFKNVKDPTWPGAWATIRNNLHYELERLWLRYDLAAKLGPGTLRAKRYALMLAEDASPSDLAELLGEVSEWCAQVAGEPVAILIDEYDAPLLTAWQYGYWDEAVTFFRAFLSAGLKDNPHLFRGVLTGILRVAKEGIFSGLNNVDVFGILDPEGATHFGFTEDEVAELIDLQGEVAGLQGDVADLQGDLAGLPDDLPGHQGLGDRYAGIADWYNGYRFGGPQLHTIYNPWSILQFLSKPARGLQPYWNNTSANELIHRLLVQRTGEIGRELEMLLRGECVTVTVSESVALQALDEDPTAVWSLLLFSGYLTAEAVHQDEHGTRCTLRIPNHEVWGVYRTTFAGWLRRVGAPDWATRLPQGLFGGDAEALREELQALLVRALSHHDFAHQPLEAVYQAFIMGLLVHLEPSHRVSSNREAGFGRADVLVVPRQPGGVGVVLELKSVRDRTPEATLASAAAQLRDRRYYLEALAVGAATVHQFAVAFDGKRCWVEAVPVEG